MANSHKAALERQQEFADAVRRDLQLTPKQLESRFLYDALGSALFDAICRLPWYQITRAETRLLARQSGFVASALPQSTILIELGCGSGEKLAMLAGAWHRRGRPIHVHLIDVSPAALEQSEQRLEPLDHVSVIGHRSTYEVGLARAAAQRRAQDRLLVLFLGSNIGNLDPPAAGEFLGEIRRALAPGDALLLGTDLVKPESELLLAYDDPLGVTAAFNKNLLVRINRELDADFEIGAFDHRAVWNTTASRVEMHLVSRSDQQVSIAAANAVVDFEPGEWIWTESSYKYTPDAVIDMAGVAAFTCLEQWIEPEARFALTLFEAA